MVAGNDSGNDDNSVLASDNAVKFVENNFDSSVFIRCNRCISFVFSLCCFTIPYK
jgi:hypothetical protein